MPGFGGQGMVHGLGVGLEAATRQGRAQSQAADRCSVDGSILRFSDIAQDALETPWEEGCMWGTVSKLFFLLTQSNNTNYQTPTHQDSKQ